MTIDAIFDEVRSRYAISDRSFTVADFYRICDAENIGVHRIDAPAKINFLFTMPGSDRRAIVLSKRRRGKRLLYAMFHELGHYFAGHEGQHPSAAFGGHSDRLHESEADRFAKLATGFSFN